MIFPEAPTFSVFFFSLLLIPDIKAVSSLVNLSRDSADSLMQATICVVSSFEFVESSSWMTSPERFTIGDLT